MENSCAVELIYRVEEKYKTLEDLDQGGINYANISIDEMFCMENSVVTSSHDFFKALSKDGLTNYQGDNFSIVTTQINVVC